MFNLTSVTTLSLEMEHADFERTLPSLGTPLFFTARSPRRFQEIAYPRPAVLIFGRKLGASLTRAGQVSTRQRAFAGPELI